MTSEKPPSLWRLLKKGKRVHCREKPPPCIMLWADSETEEVLHEGEISLLAGTWTARCWSGQAVADGKRGGGCPVLAARLVEDMGEVVNHGLLTESQCACDLATWTIHSKSRGFRHYIFSPNHASFWHIMPTDCLYDVRSIFLMKDNLIP